MLLHSNSGAVGSYYIVVGSWAYSELAGTSTIRIDLLVVCVAADTSVLAIAEAKGALLPVDLVVFSVPYLSTLVATYGCICSNWNKDVMIGCNTY